MARGGKRTQRARSKAQSAGVSHTFQGGKGGTAYGKAGGGSRGQGVRANGKLASGSTYNVRAASGDKTLGGGKGGSDPKRANLHSLSGSGAKHVAPTVRRGAAQGRGGSTQ